MDVAVGTQPRTVVELVKARSLLDQPPQQDLRQRAKGWLYRAYLYGGPRYLRQMKRWLRAEPSIRIVYYHRIGACDRVSKPSVCFEQELRYLKQNFECLTLRDLCWRLDAEERLSRPAAVITFDDGYRDNYTLAYPLLKLLGIPATFFVTTGYVGTQQVFPHDARAECQGWAGRSDWPKLQWEDVREMQASGMEIGSHTVTHANLGRCTAAQIQAEVEGSLADLKRELGDQPRAFCFPWGGENDRSDLAVAAIQKAGYYAAVTTTCGEVSQRSDRFQLPRIDVGNGKMDLLTVMARVHGFGCDRLARVLQRG